ncbi:hypothetical protein PTKIN_Ptkin02bG0255900 [Pterospermum kingtungense]
MDLASIEESHSGKKRKQICGKVVSRSTTYHHWTKEEDPVLVECLKVLVADLRWKGDNGAFRVGYLNQLEKMMESRLPDSKLKAIPYIESRVKLMKKQYNAIAEMLTVGSGFGWNNMEKCVTASKRYSFDAKGMRNKAFPHYDDFAIIFGKDRATGVGVETTADAVDQLDEEDDEVEFEEIMNNEFQAGENEQTMDDLEGSTGATSRRTRSGKRASSFDGTTDLLVEEFWKFNTTYVESIQEMRLFYRKQVEGTDKRFALPVALDELEQHFSIDKLVKVRAYISRDIHKVDYFFALGDE